MKKTGMMEQLVMNKLADMFTYFDWGHECEMWTDRIAGMYTA